MGSRPDRRSLRRLPGEAFAGVFQVTKCKRKSTRREWTYGGNLAEVLALKMVLGADILGLEMGLRQSNRWDSVAVIIDICFNQTVSEFRDKLLCIGHLSGLRGKSW